MIGVGLVQIGTIDLTSLFEHDQLLQDCIGRVTLLLITHQILKELWTGP